MRWHAHDRARTVAHQDVVCDPDRHLLAVVRIDCETPSVNPVFFNLADISGFFGPSLLSDQLINLRAQLRV